MRKVIDTQTSKKIVNDYNNNQTLKQIAKKYDTCSQVVKRVLKDNNISIRKMTKEFNFNEEYFKAIDTPNKAYFLGLLYADGHIYSTFPKIAITLKEEDGYIIKEMAEDMNSNYPIHRVSRKLNDKTFHYNYIGLTSIRLKENLIKLGCTPKKSLILEFPTEEQVPKKFHSHFIRGYFDGDGCISKTKSRCKVSICGTKSFCNSLKEILSRYNINSSTNPQKNIYSLNISGRFNIIKFKEYIYSKDCKCILRKSKLFDDWSNKDMKITNMGSMKDFMHIIQLNLEGEEINKYRGLKEVKEQLGFNMSGVSKSCRNFPKEFRGYLWKYNKEIMYENKQT
jgi:intein-encoded DNA endonuclease-like protein